MGLEAVVARELERLGYSAKNSAESAGRTRFSGDFTAIARANLFLRTAGRVLLELAEFAQADNFDTIFDAVEQIAWEDWMPPNAEILVEGRSIQSKITSVPALQRTVKKGIVNRLMKAHRVVRLPEDGPKYSVEISLRKDRASLTLDTSGSGLHRRGYRLMNVPVPLRETLAAALIQLSVWKPDRPLIDPFCASGTIPIEAAMLARNIPPGLSREFAFERWPVFPSESWREIKRAAADAILPPLEIKILGSDIDGEALRFAQHHAQLAGVADDIIFEQKDFRDLSDRRSFGCLIGNPPYGDRVGEHEEFRELYESFADLFEKLPTWSHFLITSWPDLEKIIGRQATRRRKLYNSRIECVYYQFLGPKPGQEPTVPREPLCAEAPKHEAFPATFRETPPETQREPAPEPTSPGAPSREYSAYQVEQFGRCLTNRTKHLSRWPKRGITCYRLYDRDFPEVPLAVDIFEGNCLHIAEYERPDHRSPSEHRRWLDRLMEKAGEILGVAPENIFLKRRAPQRGERQYEKLGESGRIVTVHEGGLKFLCNMTDYLDVGLFLDHRQTRARVREEAKGKRFLNLFCYTGAFTCYAADGGASETVSVDLSPTYLEWAEKNMAINGFSVGGPDAKHRFVRADVGKFLLGEASGFRRGDYQPNHSPSKSASSDPLSREKFDLCVCDPPTFSNSKSTESDWDVQRDHVTLLQNLAKRMNPGGVLFFSNNFQRFKLDEETLAEFYTIREISRQTVPDDFRNRRIHRCWRMVTR